MVVLMGGRNSEGYHLFVQLTVKAFLAIRPFADQIVETVRLMLGTGLSSFKGEQTIQRLRDRFVPGMTERQAAEWMMGVIRNAHENVRSTLYEFQRVNCVQSMSILCVLSVVLIQNGSCQFCPSVGCLLPSLQVSRMLR